MARYTAVTADEFDSEHAASLPDWTRDESTLRCVLTLGSFTAAAEFAASVARRADAMDHHPDIDLRFPGRVTISTTTHDTGGLTTHDIELARRISELHLNGE